MELLKIAYRNIYRNKRRTTMNIIAITIGISMIILLIGFFRGYITTLYQGMINFETGHVQVLNEEYYEESTRYPVDLNIKKYSELRKAILKNKRVVDASGRTEFITFLSNDMGTITLLGRGIDPEYEKNVTKIAEYILPGGNYFDNNNSGILIGEPIAKKMKINVNDQVYIRALDKYGAQNLIYVTVVGIFKFGYPVVDKHMIFLDKVNTDYLLSLEDETSKIVVRLKDDNKLKNDVAEISGIVNGFNHNTIALPWKKFAEIMVSDIESSTFAMFFIGFIFIIVVIFGIYNSLSMSVNERVNEIGTMRAIGMKKSKIIQLFLFETLIICFIAVILSLVISIGLAVFLEKIGVDLSVYAPENMPIPFGKNIYGDFKIYDFIFAIVLGVLMSILGGWVPSIKASNTNIVEILHYD